MVSKQLDEMRAKIARLLRRARRISRSSKFRKSLRNARPMKPSKSLLASEEVLFKARFSARHSQKDLLQSRMAQLTEEIAGLRCAVRFQRPSSWS